MVEKITLSDLDPEILIFFIGFFYLCKWMVRWVIVTYRSFYGTKCTADRYGVDSWAIITGATGGIGKFSALELAKRGFNIIIVSHDEGRMQEISDEITKKYSL